MQGSQHIDRESLQKIQIYGTTPPKTRLILSRWHWNEDAGHKSTTDIKQTGCSNLFTHDALKFNLM